MKSIFRFGSLLVIVALLATMPALTARAQGDMCFGLKADDCKLATTAPDSATMAKLTSFVMDYTVTAKVTGTGKNDLDLNVTGTGPFGVDTTAMAGGSDPMAAIGALTMANTIKASVTTGGQTQSGTFEFRIVGGKLYFMGDKATQGKWMSITLATALSSLMQNPMVSGMMSGNGAGGASSNPAMAAMSDPEVMQALMALPTVPGFITAERKDDIDIGGVKAATIVYNIDLLTALKSPQAKPLVKAMLKSQSAGTEPTDQQVNQIVVVAQTFLKDLKISITRYIGAADGLPVGLAFDFSLKLDAATAGMLMSSSDAKAVDANFHFDVKLTKVGEKVSVEPVADAQEIDMSGMMGGAGAMATPAK